MLKFNKINLFKLWALDINGAHKRPNYKQPVLSAVNILKTTGDALFSDRKEDWSLNISILIKSHINVLPDNFIFSHLRVLLRKILPETLLRPC